MDRRHFGAPKDHPLSLSGAPPREGVKGRGLEVHHGWVLSPHHSATVLLIRPAGPAGFGNFLCTTNAHGSGGWGAPHPPPLLLICQGCFFLEKTKVPGGAAVSLFCPVHPSPCRQAMPDTTGFIQVPDLNLPNLQSPPRARSMRLWWGGHWIEAGPKSCPFKADCLEKTPLCPHIAWLF